MFKPVLLVRVVQVFVISETNCIFALTEYLPSWTVVQDSAIAV